MSKSITRIFLSALSASAVAVVLLCGTPVAAQDPGGGGMAMQAPGDGMGGGRFVVRRPPFEQAMGALGRWWNSPRMIERLKLTDAQRKAMDQIMYDHREKLIDLQANLQRAELAMEPLMSADQPDQAAMEAQIDKIVDARAALERADARFLLDIRMKLTPDQWKQLKDLRSERMGMREHMMNHMRNGDHGGGGHIWRHRPDGQGGQPGPDGNAPANPQGNAPATPPAGQPQGSGPGNQ